MPIAVSVASTLNQVGLFDVLNILGFIVGAVGTAFGIKGFYDSRRASRAYSVILEEAAKTWEGRYSELQIEALKEQSQQLREQIRSQVPGEAQWVFLQSQRDALAQSLGEMYQQYQSVETQLGTSAGRENLPPMIKRALESELQPNYLARLRRERWVNLAARGILILLVYSVILSWSPVQTALQLSGVAFSTDGLYTYLVGATVVWLLLSLTPDLRPRQSGRRGAYGSQLGLASLAFIGWFIFTVPFLNQEFFYLLESALDFTIPPFVSTRVEVSVVGAISAVFLALTLRFWAMARQSRRLRPVEPPPDVPPVAPNDR